MADLNFTDGGVPAANDKSVGFTSGAGAGSERSWTWTNIATRISSILGLGTAATLASDNDGTLAANSSSRVPTQAAVKAYADALIAANDAMVFKGVIDCSANPNYPAADRGHVYKVSVAGKIGGGSGPNVEVGDQLLCITDSTSSGTHGSVGTAWSIIQVNIDGAVTGPASSTSGNLPSFSGTSGKVIQDSGVAIANVLVASNIGSSVQAYDADLAAIAGLSPSNDDVVQRKAGAWVNRTIAQLITDLAAGGLTGGGAALVATCNGRLTTESGVAVSTSDRTGQGTIYFTPFNGDQIALYNGSAWVLHTFTERSLALTVTSGKNYDVFLYDNSGTLTLELSNAWTDDITRADSLATQNGVFVKSGATTRRWLGTIRASGTNTTEDSDTKRFVWNCNNQVERRLFVCPGYSNDTSATSWNTTSTTWTEANGGTNGRAAAVVGCPQTINMFCQFWGTTPAGYAEGGMALDSTSNAVVELAAGSVGATIASGAPYAFMPTAGYHYVALLVRTNTGTATFYADDVRAGASADPYLTFLSGTIKG